MKPIAALSMLWGTAMMFFFAVRSTGAHIPGIPDLQARWSQAAADGEALTVLSVVIALFFLLFREQQQTTRERAILVGEMQAGREVQRHLVPLALPPISGFRCGSAYLPAAEVGGDFYQLFPQSGGSHLIVIGDVSGKGLKAAMTGSVVLGALRSLAQENLSPAQILSRLNAQLAASSDGGFVTCLCVRTAADGTLTLANAGHLAPYRNGEEISLDSGLPLGIAAETTYPESTVQLAAGDTLTFLSDGVVEALSQSGELFGFDRTREISCQSAEEISRAAQAFGQQDDITVLTLAFAPAEVLRA
jgi:serine phosphatase RsbU (regulator of sigma subunit)